jgi:molybdopterin-synthase adenylyltransferase
VMLSPEEVERYARHIVLREIGGPGQQKLKQARVLVIGAGGLGSPVIQYLAASGIGTIGIIDDDEVSLSNLQRQILYTTHDVGEPKTDKAALHAAKLNPHVNLEPHALRLTQTNALSLISQYDIIADGSDNFSTRYLVADTCIEAQKTLVTASLGRFDGAITTFKAHEFNSQGKPNPTYRCLFPEPPPEGTVLPCAEAGILGPLAGIMGSLMALEIMREIIGFGEGLTGKLLLVDALTLRFQTIHYERAEASS